MPHQCLKCGKVFQEGSSQLLKGCPDCGGNRFFFTKEPLNETQRNQISKKVGKDINSQILDFIDKNEDELVDKSGYWVKLKAKDLRKAMEKHITKNPSDEDSYDDKKEIDILTDDGYRKAAIEKINSELNKSDRPETIDIERPGSYNIDLKGLLEEEPIIIQKDGTYTIHLPSIFKMLDKEK